MVPGSEGTDLTAAESSNPERQVDATVLAHSLSFVAS